jgi:hypothetical protein
MTYKYEKPADVVYAGMNDFLSQDVSANAKSRLVADAFPAQQTAASLKSMEQPHNYIGAVADIGNGMINEVRHNSGQLLETFAESAVAGVALRFAPPVVRGAALTAGVLLGAYEIGTHAPGWINDASTVINESSHTAQERARAHVGLEHIGGGIVELGAGFKGFGRGMYAPEAYAATRSVSSEYLGGTLKASELIPEMKLRFDVGVKAVDWAATPPWIAQTSKALKSQFEGARSWFKPNTAASDPSAPLAEAGADVTPSGAPRSAEPVRQPEAADATKGEHHERVAAAPPPAEVGIERHYVDRDGKAFTVTETPFPADDEHITGAEKPAQLRSHIGRTATGETFEVQETPDPNFT